MQPAGVKLDLVPLQIAQLRGAQAMPVRDQDHGRITVTVAGELASCRHQGLDLGGGEIVPGAGD
jgi:hypothetical protein